MKKSHLFLWLPCLIYYAFITTLSAIPSTNWAGTIHQPFPHFDKLVHFILYAFFGMIVSRALSWEQYLHHLRKRWFYYFALIIPVAAVIDEIHQYFVPSRSMEFFDFLADVSGAVCGGLFYILILRGRSHGREISDLEESDSRGFGLVVAMIYFMVLICLNLFNYKQGLLKNYSYLAYAFILRTRSDPD